MTISIYSPSWNEQMLLAHYYRWYKDRFSNVSFNIFDNQSNDLTVWLASAFAMNGQILTTNDTYIEAMLLDVKGNRWKGNDGWVISCDIDEWIDINEQDLMREIERGTTIIRTEGYDMCNTADTMNLTRIRNGVRNPLFDKSVMFDASKISDIGYSAGCHKANPQGEVIESERVYKLYHMKYWNKSYFVARYEAMQKRQSEYNRLNSYGIHYMRSRTELETEYDEMIEKAKEIV